MYIPIYYITTVAKIKYYNIMPVLLGYASVKNVNVYNTQ